MNKSAYALIDCNNFYVSCERVFNPKLWNKPVMVLSNNDGCVVARSQEVKDIGIPMGCPFFKCKDLIKKYDIKVLSSNYTLYADMSSRVTEVLKSLGYETEIYSIDESFIRIPIENINNIKNKLIQIRKKIYKWTGIPVSIGLAQTKVLSKIANKYAKKHNEMSGVCNFFEFTNKEIDNILANTPCEDLWGIGRRLAFRLKKINVTNAFQLKNSNQKEIRKILTVMGERIVLELNNTVCYDLEQNPKLKKQIACTRSFGNPVSTFKQLSEAVSNYTSQACEDLRRSDAFANIIIVFIRTNRFKQNEKHYANAAYIKLPQPLFTTHDITKYALLGLKRIYKTGFRYKKAGVILSGIHPQTEYQFNLFYKDTGKSIYKQKKLMKAIDDINQKWGSHLLHLLSEGTNQNWKMLREKLSKKYTTDPNEILEVS